MWLPSALMTPCIMMVALKPSHFLQARQNRVPLATKKREPTPACEAQANRSQPGGLKFAFGRTGMKDKRAVFIKKQRNAKRRSSSMRMAQTRPTIRSPLSAKKAINSGLKLRGPLKTFLTRCYKAFLEMAFRRSSAEAMSACNSSKNVCKSWSERSKYSTSAGVKCSRL